MAEKRDHLATMNSKGLEDAVTDQEAKAMIEKQGGTSLLLVEVTHGPYTNNLDGSQRISLIPGVVALIPRKQETAARKMLKALVLEQPVEKNGTEPMKLDGDAAAPTPAELAGWDGNPDAPADPASEADSDQQPAGEGEGPWPGDDGYTAPDEDGITGAPVTEDVAADDLAAARAKAARAK